MYLDLAVPLLLQNAKAKMSAGARSCLGVNSILKHISYRVDCIMDHQKTMDGVDVTIESLRGVVL